MATHIRLNSLFSNPNNPRVIKDHKFDKLVDNIRRYPALLAVRPIVVESRRNPMILGGNMRFAALQHIGYTKIPDSWVRYADELTPEECQAFIILDNVGFGEWDMDALANEWSAEQLSDWGVDLPRLDTDYDDEGEQDDNTVSQSNPTYKLEVSFEDEKDQKDIHSYLSKKGYQCKIINS